MSNDTHRTISRRNFLASASAAAGAVALPRVLRAQEAAAGRRPNVVYVFSDEHRWHSMSFTDMPEVKTPNMAKLAQQGVSFDNCISNYPVCSPHRAILMTGRWPYQMAMLRQSPGMVDNGHPLSPEQPTIGKAFKQAGYATCYIGKWHLGGTRAEPFGFDLSLIWLGTDNHWDSYYVTKDGKQVRSTRYNPTHMTDQAMELIESNRTRPFFCMLSLNPPHYRFDDPPPDKKALYPDAKAMPQRPNYDAGSHGKGGLRRFVEKVGEEEAIKQLTQRFGKGKATRMVKRAVRQLKEGYVPGEADWVRYQGYHGHVTAIDEELGRLMAKLAALGLAENTILVYSSDHGSMLGSHGLGNKRHPHEESIKTPFLVRWPKEVAAGQRVESLFGTIDIMPTVCSLAGVGVPETCVGQDLSAAVRRGRAEGTVHKGQSPWPDPESQFIMHIARKGGANDAPFFRGVRTKRYTYTVREVGPWLLFDNEKDPYQLKNLIDNPATADVRARLHGMVADWVKKADDPFVMPDANAATSEQRNAKAQRR